MTFRSARRRLLPPIALGLAYAVAAAAAVANTRFGGGVAYIWIANALLIGQLTLLPRRRWGPFMLAAFLASVPVTTIWGLGMVAALPLGLANVAEALLIALFLQRLSPDSMQFDSVERLAHLVFAAGLAALLVGFGAAAVVAPLTGTGYWPNCFAWVTGHVLGAVAFTPIARLAIGGDIGRCLREAKRSERAEMAALLLLVAIVTVTVFAQDARPLLFLPILPIMLATFRLGQLGASISIVLVALIGGWLTLSGHGPVRLIAAAPGERVQFFQFYLAVTVLTVLPVAAELSRRRRLFEQLRDSEARYRLITDHSSDIVMNVDIKGRIRFVSPSITQFGHAGPEALIGRLALPLVAESDREAAVAAHRRAITHPGDTAIVEYRALTAKGEERWMEEHSRAVVDEAGVVTGVVNVIRDIAHRKSIEAELSRVAATDPLTGLANRRAFHGELARRFQVVRDGGLPSCVAIFDLDHFKAVNDRWGHDVGDRVLECFATVARRSVREHDLVARLGGEEFAVILAGATLEQARQVCERLRVAVAEAPIRAGAALVPITVSAGLAVFDGTRQPSDVLRAADAALYRAKHAGRNRLDLAA